MSAEPSGPSSPDKLLWPQAGFTKQDLWSYYEAVADRLLGHLAGRPLTLLRHPGGVEAGGFLQKDIGEHAPAGLRRVEVWSPSAKRTVAYAVARTVDDLRWMANMAAVELHHTLALADRLDRPDRIVFDLDPGDDPGLLVPAAGWLRETLDELGLASMVKTTGQRGLHIVVPIQRRYVFADVRGFGLAVSRACAAEHPDALTVEMRIQRRGGRLLLDWSRNGPAQTIVSAWSPRAQPEATVSTPLAWHEVTPDLAPEAFTLSTVRHRPDPWADPPAPQRIERARAALAARGFDSTDRSPRGSAPVT